MLFKGAFITCVLIILMLGNYSINLTKEYYIAEGKEQYRFEQKQTHNKINNNIENINIRQQEKLYKKISSIKKNHDDIRFKINKMSEIEKINIKEICENPNNCLI